MATTKDMKKNPAPSKQQTHDDFTRGFFCAVAQLINAHGCDTPARELFQLGGDPALADAPDAEVFRQHGLMP